MNCQSNNKLVKREKNRYVEQLLCDNLKIDTQIILFLALGLGGSIGNRDNILYKSISQGIKRVL